jgi:hypothetical protein
MPLNAYMQTIEEIRRDWIEVLIARYGSIAALNEAVGRPRTDATFSQLRTKAPNSGTGRVRVMGSDLARSTEKALKLPPGALDNPPLITRLESADPATRAMIELALADPQSPLPAGLSPSVKAMVDMARAAIRQELGRANPGP